MKLLGNGLRHNRLSAVHTLCFHQIPEKNGNTRGQCMGILQTSIKSIIQLEGRSCIVFSLSLIFS